MSHEEQHNIAGGGYYLKYELHYQTYWIMVWNHKSIYSEYHLQSVQVPHWNYSLKVINISRKIHQGTSSVLLSKRKWLIYIPQRAETKEFIASRAGGSWCLICTWDSVPLANFNPVLLPRILQDKTKNVVTEKLIQE